MYGFIVLLFAVIPEGFYPGSVVAVSLASIITKSVLPNKSKGHGRVAVCKARVAFNVGPIKKIGPKSPKNGSKGPRKFSLKNRYLNKKDVQGDNI